MGTSKVNVNWNHKHEKKYLSLKINGFLAEEIALTAITKWKEEMTNNIKLGEKANIICDCINMTGYDTKARKQWQQTISELKSQIGCMWIITDNKIFRIAASTMGLMANLKIKTAKSESEIYFE